MPLTEADTCRKYVLPRLYEAKWDDDQICEQHTFTDGSVVVAGNKVSRQAQKLADYILRYRRDFAAAVIEAVNRWPAYGISTGLKEKANG